MNIDFGAVNHVLNAGIMSVTSREVDDLFGIYIEEGKSLDDIFSDVELLNRYPVGTVIRGGPVYTHSMKKAEKVVFVITAPSEVEVGHGSRIVYPAKKAVRGKLEYNLYFERHGDSGGFYYRDISRGIDQGRVEKFVAELPTKKRKKAG